MWDVGVLATRIDALLGAPWARLEDTDPSGRDLPTQSLGREATPGPHGGWASEPLPVGCAHQASLPR